MNFDNYSWKDTAHLQSKKFICWNCGNVVASVIGYRALYGSYYKDAPFVNQTYNDYNAYKEAVTSFHNEKVAQFLNKYYE